MKACFFPRFLTVFSIKLDVILAAGSPHPVPVLAGSRHPSEKPGQSHVKSETAKASHRVLDRDWLWIGVVLVAGIFLETQNTGSQEFIFLWPVLLAMLLKTSETDRKTPADCLLSRRLHGDPDGHQSYARYAALYCRRANLCGSAGDRRQNHGPRFNPQGPHGSCELLESHYAQIPGAYRQLAEQDQLPSWQLYSELDYQMYWVISADRVVKAIKQFESDNGVRLNTLMTLDFVNPFPWILDRDAPRNIQIGADPFRTVGSLTAAEEASFRATDGVLRPSCPTTSARLSLQRIYEKALSDRKVVKLDDCWDLLIRSDIKLSGQS